jgi:hypothetical protein
MAWARLATPSLLKITDTLLRTVRSLMPSRAPMAWLSRPLQSNSVSGERLPQENDTGSRDP